MLKTVLLFNLVFIGKRISDPKQVESKEDITPNSLHRQHLACPDFLLLCFFLLLLTTYVYMQCRVYTPNVDMQPKFTKKSYGQFQSHFVIISKKLQN